MSNNIWTVSGLIQSIRQTLDQNVVLKSFWLQGELSNFTAHHTGHWYFSIKDEGARIQCVMFQGYTREVTFAPKNGDKILIRASVTVYPVQGQLQCTVFSMQNAGLGDLYQQFERLKKKLFEAGLFEDAHKKLIPLYPLRIGIISGKNTAALQDILKTFLHRWPMAELFIFETLVQGKSAAPMIAETLKKADQAGLDLILLARGGGSIEDLWAFNEELVAITLYHMKTPVITGIGHETDTTIADMVADLRAPTPTGAVQLAVRDYREVLSELSRMRQLLVQGVTRRLNENRLRLGRLMDSTVMRQPETLTQGHRLQISLMSQALLGHSESIKLQQKRVNATSEDLKRLGSRIMLRERSRLEVTDVRLNHAIEVFAQKRKTDFASKVSLLDAFSPLKSLKRGYSLTTQDNRLIKSVQEVDYARNLTIRLADGTLLAQPIPEGGTSHE